MRPKPLETRIIHQEVRESNKSLSPGHWFFHSGQDALCAEASKAEDGRWIINLLFETSEKPKPRIPSFRTLEELKVYLGDYFGCAVERGAHPKPDY